MKKFQKCLKFKKNKSQETHSSTPIHYNYLMGMAMMFMMFMILSGITIYKLVHIGWFVFPAALLITPVIYSLCNVTTEVYGYAISRNMMWWFILISLIFSVTSYILIQAPSPSDFQHQAAFDLILGSMPRVFIAGTIGSIIGISVNNIIVSKYKAILQGKKYWLRSFISTIGGEIAYTVVAYPIMYIGLISYHQFLQILLSVILFKIFTTLALWPFECLFAAFLKKKEGVDVIDYDIKYKIFSFKIDTPQQKPVLKIVK